MNEKSRDQRVASPNVHRRRNAVIVVSTIAALATVVGAAFVTTGGPGSVDRDRDAPSPQASASTPPSPPAGDEQEAGVQDEPAESVVTEFLAISAQQVDPAEVAESGELNEVARGAMLNELEAESLELEESGLTRSGAPTVIWMRETAADATAPQGSIAVEACLDSSAVIVEAQDGGAVIASPTTRAINIFTLAPVDGALRVVARSFPDDPAC